MFKRCFIASVEHLADGYLYLRTMAILIPIFLIFRKYFHKYQSNEEFSTFDLH